MEYYLYSVDLPFSGVKLNYRELNNREYIMLSKANAMLPLTTEYAPEYAAFLQKILMNCVEDKEEFLKLNIIEYIMFACKLRMVSIGNEIELQIDDSNKEVETSIIKLNLNLQKLIIDLYNLCQDSLSETYIEENGVYVILDWPNLKSELNFLTNQTVYADNTILAILESVPEFIKKISINNQDINMSGFTSSQRSDLYNKLPTKIQNKIQTIVLRAIKYFTENTVFNEAISKYLKLSFYNLSCQNLLRLFFAENIQNIYQQYYVLASKNISPDYLDKVSIADRQVYYSFVEEEYKSKQADQENSNYLNEGPTSFESAFGGGEMGEAGDN